VSGGVYYLDAQGALTEMKESAFAVELDLQDLVARHPNLLVGDQIDPASPRKWLLIDKEVGIPDVEEGGSRWALDLLFLDQDGVPTLVEVKRGSNPQVRREVVGQMFDYAASSVLYWTAETIRESFEARCQREGVDADEQLGVLLEGDAAAILAFWQRVKTNFQAGNVRLIFVADEIPSELRCVVEFLNQRLDPVEVLAVEIRQYASGQQRTLVPVVFGQTSEALGKKSGGRRLTRQWDEASFFVELSSRRGQEEVDVARRLLAWAARNGCRIWWGKGVQDGSFFPMVDYKGSLSWTISVWTYGRVEIQFQRLLTRPPFEPEARRVDLLDRLNAALGEFSIPRNGIDRRPSIPLLALARPGVLDRFLNVLDWLLAEIRGT
jgi:hypothetical protein